MRRYFKLVALRTNKTKWIYDRFLNGKVHFGWGWKGMDLRRLMNMSRDDMDDDERIVWRYTQFLVKRIKKGDRLVLQFERPLRKFVIAEVVGGYGFESHPLDDFNHYIECKPIVQNFIPLNAQIIPNYLRHDLTKRGHYYEIYPENSIKQLDLIISKELWKNSKLVVPRKEQDDLDETRRLVIQSAIDTISARWKGADFEAFVCYLISQIKGVGVKRKGDSKKGWDLTVTITDPVTGDTLYDNVPVQCKNFSGKVNILRPIEDLERCIKYSESSIAYLFIMGDLNDEYRRRIDLLQEEMTTECKRTITLKIVDQETIANLYLSILENGKEVVIND